MASPLPGKPQQGDIYLCAFPVIEAKPGGKSRNVELDGLKPSTTLHPALILKVYLPTTPDPNDPSAACLWVQVAMGTSQPDYAKNPAYLHVDPHPTGNDLFRTTHFGLFPDLRVDMPFNTDWFKPAKRPPYKKNFKGAHLGHIRNENNISKRVDLALTAASRR